MASKSNSKSMDIQKPGDTKPDTSARPIIVTNRPILQDPMVKNTNSVTPTPEEQKTPEEEKEISKTTKTLEPSQELVTEEENSKQEEAVTEPTDNANEDAPDSETEKNLVTKDSIPESKESDSAVVDAVVAGAAQKSGKSEQQLIEDEDEKRHQAAQVLIDSKKYIVPIGQVTRARHNRHALILLIVIVLFAAVYVSIDIGLIHVPFTLPVHLVN